MIFVKSSLIIFIVFVLSVSQESIDEDILITDDPLDTSVKIFDTTAAKISVTDPERLFLITTDLALPIHGTFTLAFERTIHLHRTLAITGILSDEINKPGLRAVALYLGMHFYSKKAFNGWFIAPNIGYKLNFELSREICINLHGGYRWELPGGFSIGFGFGPGISGAFSTEEKNKRFGFDFFGGFYLGKAFGLYSPK